MVFVTELPWLLSLRGHQKCFTLWIFPILSFLVCSHFLPWDCAFVLLSTAQYTKYLHKLHMCVLNLLYYNLNLCKLFQIKEALYYYIEI